MRVQLSLAALFLLVSPALAQEAPKPKPQPSVFSQVIPKPTGRNGYEDLVMAGELLKSSKLFQQAKEGNATLAAKRTVLSDRTVARVLALINQGLRKPVLQPRETMSFSTLLPELQLFRDLGKLLAMQQYVFLADGREQDALAVARTCMRLGNVIQNDTLIHGLIGISTSSVCINSLGQHLDQLSERDCRALYEVCLEWLNQPNPQLRVLEGERRLMVHCLVELRETLMKQGPEKAAALLGVGKELEEYRSLLPPTPEAADQLFGEVQKRMDQFYVRVVAELRKPMWERQPVKLEPGTDVPGALVGMITPAYEKVNETYTKEQARIQLLACHAAIRAYRWQHDRLPASLDILNLGDLARDPFTGSPLTYAPRGSRYSLTSVGAPAPDQTAPNVVNGRIPIGLTPDD
jgi:hypothetical protein